MLFQEVEISRPPTLPSKPQEPRLGFFYGCGDASEEWGVEETDASEEC